MALTAVHQMEPEKLPIARLFVLFVGCYTDKLRLKLADGFWSRLGLYTCCVYLPLRWAAPFLTFQISHKS
jgi:hypothetical protein